MNKYIEILKKVEGKKYKNISEIKDFIGIFLVENFEIKENKRCKLSDIYNFYISYLIKNNKFPDYFIGKQGFNTILKYYLTKENEEIRGKEFGLKGFCIWSDRPFVVIRKLSLKNQFPDVK